MDPQKKRVKDTLLLIVTVTNLKHAFMERFHYKPIESTRGLKLSTWQDIEYVNMNKNE